MGGTMNETVDYSTRPLHRCVCGQRGRWTFVWRVWQCVSCGRVAS